MKKYFPSSLQISLKIIIVQAPTIPHYKDLSMRNEVWICQKQHTEVAMSTYLCQCCIHFFETVFRILHIVDFIEKWIICQHKIRCWVARNFTVRRTHTRTSIIVPHAHPHRTSIFDDRTRTRTRTFFGIPFFLFHTLFPQIISEETILIWIWPYLLWPLMTVHKVRILF